MGTYCLEKVTPAEQLKQANNRPTYCRASNPGSPGFHAVGIPEACARIVHISMRSSTTTYSVDSHEHKLALVGQSGCLVALHQLS
jgi:hypothetical protein